MDDVINPAVRRIRVTNDWRRNHLAMDYVYVRQADGEYRVADTLYELVTDDPDDPVYHVSYHLAGMSSQAVPGQQLTIAGHRLTVVELDYSMMEYRCLVNPHRARVAIWRNRLRNHWLMFKVRCAATRHIWRG